MAVLMALFTESINISATQHGVLLIPLCLAVAVVYKTVRCQYVANIPLSSAVLCVTIVVGMYAVGVGMWLLHLLFV